MRFSPLLFLGAAFLLAGCGQDASEEGAQPPPRVTVAPLTERSVTSHADFTGRAMAVDTVRARARVWGYLDKIKFTEGQEVKKGQGLFVIDQRPYKATLERAEGEVGQAAARVKRLENDFARAKDLLASRAISREDFDRVAGDLSEATSALRVAT